MSITYTKGREWWLLRTNDEGKCRYPDIIKVGELDNERIYVPLTKPAQERLERRLAAIMSEEQQKQRTNEPTSSDIMSP